MAIAHKVKVKSYWDNNLRFDYLNFKGDCLEVGQDITYYGVGANFQNAVTESKIKEMYYGTRVYYCM